MDSLAMIFNNFAAPEAFMTDGGKHFDNHAVKEFCAKWSCKHHVVAAYSPHPGLCALNLGEDGETDEEKENLL
ncbi:hypothetical protein PISMIDRAFT_12185 [Pisolithus microcarpus 441]|uniref:Integrase catalytic domain-containing protein n=1 Tax=Pisolithus microcarpus 441 TaxID=765257 RepID=A0A0C9ZP83_9AGAM|nr:hypothetical protein PISMIDRAFT_12185 [Pisolithus microcarpus 441]